MSDRIKLIFNPASRGGRSKKKAIEVNEKLSGLGVEHDLYETTHPQHAIKLAEDAKNEGYNIVCSIGGDGTAHEVANGAIRAGVTFGLIPAGSGNDFSKGIGLTGDVDQAIDTLLDGKEEKISIIKMDDRYSINIADVGLGASAVRYSINHLKWMHGSFKYTLLMVRALMGHKATPTKLILDGEEHNFNINILAAGYGQSFGSGMLVLPDARFNHDKMTIGIVKNANKFTILRVFPKVFSGTHVNITKYVSMLSGSKLEILQPENRDLHLEAEGELVGQAPVTFEAIPKGMKVKIPENWDLNRETLFVD